MNYLLKSSDAIAEIKKQGGGKATHLGKLSQAGFEVPPWFVIRSSALEEFIKTNQLEKAIEPQADLARFSRTVEEFFVKTPLSKSLELEVEKELNRMNLQDRFVAVRSSGLDEDSAENSFAGQFSTYLFQKGMPAISESIRKCWASGFSERALAYRLQRGLGLTDIRVGVVIQLMVNAESAGVAFSRNPMRPLDREKLIVSSVWGLGEGLVSGELDADHFEVHRETLESHSTIVEKSHALRQAPEGGLTKVDLSSAQKKDPSLSPAQVKEVAKLALSLEKKLGQSQDCEWAFQDGKLYCLQTRPITTLPPDAFFSKTINGIEPILWDNSNIIESYSGVTTPFTFSFANAAYRQVYLQFCEVMGVPRHLVRSHESVFRNMLGLVRGRIYYNLINWYRVVLLLPGAGSNKGFMETMMGVRQQLKPEVASIFDFMKEPPKYSFLRKFAVTVVTIYRFIQMDKIIGDFQKHFNTIYQKSRKIDFETMSLGEQARYYEYIQDEILTRWKAPIINDYLCMVFFGSLKKLTEKWITIGEPNSSLQNDLLCGQGDLESTEPTKLLMRMAEKIDNGDPAIRDWISGAKPEALWEGLQAGRAPAVLEEFRGFLDKYGFRCVNELKLEEKDLHDDPSFALSALSSYVRMKTYSIHAMEERERAIVEKAEARVRAAISGIKRLFYFWILKQARRAVRNRESLRFDRTKIFGVVRHIIRAMGSHLHQLGVLKDPSDVFYLTLEELFAFQEGRPVALDVPSLVAVRKKEYAEYHRTPPPPDRLLTYGSAGASMRYVSVLADADLLRSEAPVSDDPNILLGTPCSPGVVEGVVRVVKEIKEAEGMSGEILVTERTDPGWVPLYPSCSGILIERGSLLSHSAVVARELGIPTIVGVTGGLMKKLKTGQRVRVDAGKGEIRIL